MLVLVCKYNHSPHLSITYFMTGYKHLCKIADGLANNPELDCEWCKVMSVHDLPMFLESNMVDVFSAQW